MGTTQQRALRIHAICETFTATSGPASHRASPLLSTRRCDTGGDPICKASFDVETRQCAIGKITRDNSPIALGDTAQPGLIFWGWSWHPPEDSA